MNGSGPPPLIVHIIFRLDFGGLENGLVNLVNNLPRDRYRHVIICLAGFNPVFRARIQNPDVEVISLDKHPGKDPGAYLRLWRLLRRLRPAIVHTRNLGTVDLQWVAWAAGVPHRVHGEHGWEASDPRGLDPKGLRIRRACRPVIQRYVPMSQDIARWLGKHVGVEVKRMRQIYSGVDTGRFGPSPSAVGTASLTLGTVGRFDPIKNQGALLTAFARLAPRFPNLRLTIVGDGSLKAALQAQAASLGLADRVTFTGARSDTPDLLRGFDVFVLPSLNEGVSNTILEAMATGLPVVAGRVGGNPELVVDDVTGRLYDPGGPAALEQALLPYLTDPALREAHGAAARRRVVQYFRLEAMVQRYLDLYDELLAPVPAFGGTGLG
jgi:sugar transferase (PEP-CTERM/EpsH1 system associated)